MGACCAGGAPAKEPEDNTLDELEVEEIGVGQFDEVFSGAVGPVNTAVTLNNAIITSIDKLKEVAAALIGAKIIKVTNAGSVGFDVFSVDDGGAESKMGEADMAELYKSANGADLRKAHDQCRTLLNNLNTAVSEAGGLSVRVKKARVFLDVGEVKEEDAPKVKAAKTAVMAFNNKMFKLKLELVKASAAEALDPKVALRQLVDAIKGALKDAFRPNVVVDLGGLAEGNVNFDINMGDFAVDAMPPRIRMAYLAIMGDDPDDLGIVPTLRECIEALSGLVEQINAVKAAVEGLPQNPGDAQSAFTEAGLTGAQLLKAPGRFGGNLKAVGGAPAVMQTLLNTVSSTCNDIKEAMESA